MLPKFLIPVTVARQDGAGMEMPGESKIVLLTLGITRIIARESLEVSVWGSADAEEWRFLFAFPQKSYCGSYSMVLDLTRHPGVQYLRAQWKMGRWTRDERAPLFEFYLRAEEGLLHQLGQVAADAVG
jgi:hypothetical protein